MSRKMPDAEESAAVLHGRLVGRRELPLRDLLTIGTPIVAVLLVAMSGSPYLAQLTLGIVILAVIALSWDVLARTGLVSFGQAAFFGMGAYATAVLDAWLPLALSWIVGIAFCALIAALVGLVTLRLSGVYFAISTLGLALLMQDVVIAAKPLTGGSTGIATQVMPGGVTGQLVIYGVFLLVALLCSRFVLSRRLRPAVFMMRGDPALAASSGVPVARLRIGIYVLSAALAGLAGAMYGALYGYVVPTDVFNLDWSAFALAAAVLGGMDHVAGAVVGAVVLRLTETATQGLVGGGGYTIVYGLLVIVVILVAPSGLSGIGKSVARRVRRHLSGGRV